MKIISVNGADFGPFQAVSFGLTEKGLVLLKGNNQDDTSSASNGAGKSELPDLLNWVLWGTTARGSKGDAIIRRGEKKAVGKVVVEDDSLTPPERWTVERTRAKGKENLTLTSTIVGEPTFTDHTLGTNALTQALVERMLGCSEDVFRAAVYVGQEDLPDLPLMTDKTLKEIIERAAGVDAFERAMKIASEQYLEVVRKVGSARNALVVLDTEQLGLIARRGDAERSAAEWDAENELRRIALNERYDEAVLSIAMTNEALEKGITAEKIAAGIKVITDKLALTNAQVIEQTRLDRAVATCESELRAATIKYDTASRAALVAQSHIDGVHRRVGEPCGECGTLLLEEHLTEVLASLAVKKRDAATALTDALEGRSTADSSLTAARSALALHVKGMTDSSALHEQKAKLMVALRERNALVARFESEKAIVAAIDLEIEHLKVAVNPHIATITMLEDGLKRVAHDIELGQAVIVGLDQAVADAQTVKEVFGPTGVRAHMLDEITPYLNDRTGEYLSTLSDGNLTATWSTLTKNKKGEYKERFAIDVAKNDEGSFVDLSGGQKRKVRIACALALQDLVASRATKPFDCWICDEIDTALDAPGLERLMMVLQAKALDRGTVIVISHSDLTSWISNVWTVTLKDKVSTLSTT